MTLRKVTSLTTLLSFILLIITSIILYITPQGKVAFWANWSCWGLGKEAWGALHTNLGFLFILAGVIHTVLNWNPIVAYLKNKAKEFKLFTGDFNISLAITLIITIMTLFEVPPIHAIQTFGESLKIAAAEKYGDPPYGHAEVSSLETFCKRTGIDLNDALNKLKNAQLQGVAAERSLDELARANRMTPQAVYSLFKPEPLKKGEMLLMPESPGMGFGRKTLHEVCAQYGLEEEQILQALKDRGINGTAGQTMKTIGENNDTDPHALYEILRQIQQK